MQTYNFNDDLTDQKRDYLGLLMMVTGFINIAAVIIPLFFLKVFPAAWLVLMAALVVAELLRRGNRVTLASSVYLGGLLVLPALLLITEGPIPGIYILLLLPIGLSAMLLESKIDAITTTAVGIMIVGTSHHTGLIPSLGVVALPAAAAVVLAIIVYVMAHNNLDYVYWALDSQFKNAERAEVFYQQGEQLKQAMLDVQHANSKLEHMNVELGEAQSRAERANNAKSVFLSNMSHELRTPLNVIIGYTSSMLNMPQMYNNAHLPEIYHNDIELIKENGQYLVGLINDILDLSKIEAGRLVLHCEPVNISEVLRGTTATSIGLLKDKPLQIIPDFPDNMPLVWADPMRLRQIVLNLMSNAIKFTETGSVTLSARQEDSSVRISVTDTGIGIPEAVLPTIFDRFKQAELDTDKRYGGTGLGLDISQQLTRMHGGELTVASVEGRGTTFSFTLPFAAAEELAAPAPIQSMSSVKIFDDPSVVLDKVVHTILLVEDDANTRTMLRRALENNGHVVIDTNNGAQVMDLAQGLLPALVILDMNLPNRSGWEILQELTHNPETSGIPVMVCTVDEDYERSAQLGAALHLCKPITPEQIINGVNKLLSTSSQPELRNQS
jgi:signal transduction histidine kinase/CheY-like chemotaxis protein